MHYELAPFTPSSQSGHLRDEEAAAVPYRDSPNMDLHSLPSVRRDDWLRRGMPAGGLAGRYLALFNFSQRLDRESLL